MTTFGIILTVMITWQVFGMLHQAITWKGEPFGAVIAFVLNALFLAGLLYIGGVL